MHASLVVDLDPGLFITNSNVALSANGQSLQKSRNAQIGVEILGLTLKGDRIDISKLITNKDAVSLVMREPLQLLVEGSSDCRVDIALLELESIEDG